jgi:hypothetical protein
MTAQSKPTGADVYVATSYASFQREAIEILRAHYDSVGGGVHVEG